MYISIKLNRTTNNGKNTDKSDTERTEQMLGYIFKCNICDDYATLQVRANLSQRIIQLIKNYNPQLQANSLMQLIELELQKTPDDQIRRLFDPKQGIQYAQCFLQNQRLISAENYNHKITFYPTISSKFMFNYLKTNSRDKLIQIVLGQKGIGKSFSTLLYHILSMYQVKYKMQQRQKSICKKAQQISEYEVEKVFYIPSPSIKKELIGSIIKNQASQFDIPLQALKKATLKQFLIDISRNYWRYGIKTLFVLDKTNYYFSQMRKFAERLSLGQAQPEKQFQIYKISNLIQSICRIPEQTISSSVILLSSNTMEVNLLQLPGLNDYFNPTKQSKKVKNIVLSKYSNDKVIKQQLKKASVFQIERFLNKFLSHDYPQKQSILKSIKQKWMQNFNIGQSCYDLNFLKIRKYIEIGYMNALSCKNIDYFQKYSIDGIKQLTQPNTNEEITQIQNFALKKFKAENKVCHKNVRIIFLQFIRNEAKKAPETDTFSVSLQKIIEYYRQNFQCSSDLTAQKFIEEQILYQSYSQLNPKQMQINFFMNPYEYLRLTKFVEKQFYKNFNSYSKGQGEISGHVLGKIIETQFIELFRGCVRTDALKLNGQQTLYFEREHSCFQHFIEVKPIQQHFLDAFQRLTKVDKDKYIFCMPVTQNGSLSQNSPSFDLAFVSRVQQKQYKIITINITINSRLATLIGFGNKSKSKIQKAIQMYQKILKKKKEFLWNDSLIHVNFHHYLLTTKDIAKQVNQTSKSTKRLQFIFKAYGFEQMEIQGDRQSIFQFGNIKEKIKNYTQVSKTQKMKGKQRNFDMKKQGSLNKKKL